MRGPRRPLNGRHFGPPLDQFHDKLSGLYGSFGSSIGTSQVYASLVATGLTRRAPGIATTCPLRSWTSLSRQARVFPEPVRPGADVSGPTAAQSVLGRLSTSQALNTNPPTIRADLDSA
jgi:hypothetical protein